VQLELLFDGANLDLVADRIDIAIRLAPNYQPNVIGVKLFETRYRVVASPDYIKREGAPKRPADISARSCVLFPMPEFRTRWLFRRGQKISEARVAGNLVLSTASAIKQAALAGLGPALLPQWLIDEDLAAKRLVDLFPAYQVAATTFDTAAWLLYPSREYLPRKVRLAIDFFRERLVMRG
jgi:DNA-binding transcriptional LysR family regulator